MVFYPKSFDKGFRVQQPLFLDNVILRWSSQHKYLGIFIDAKLCDNCDINRQLRSFYARGNMLIRKFSSCDVKKVLFQTYCSNMYGSHLWNNYSAECIRKIKTAYNNIARLFFKLKRDDSMSSFYVTLGIHFLYSLRRTYISSFISRVTHSDNLLVNVISSSSYFICISHLLQQWIQHG